MNAQIIHDAIKWLNMLSLREGWKYEGGVDFHQAQFFFSFLEKLRSFEDRARTYMHAYNDGEM